MAGEIYTGSAPEDAQAHRGWALGHFMPPGDIRHSADVEIKWGVHPQGDQRAQWVTGEVRTAVIVLVSGRFRIDFREHHPDPMAFRLRLCRPAGTPARGTQRQRILVRPCRCRQ